MDPSLWIRPGPLVAACVAWLVGCAPPPSVTNSGTATSSGIIVTEFSATSSGDPACPDIHEGDLTITSQTDLDALRTVRRVMGSVTIDRTSLPDLGFFECLQQIDTQLRVSNNRELLDLSGLESLEVVGITPDPIGTVDGVYVSLNPSLLSLAGLDRVEYLRKLAVLNNVALEDLALPRLREVDRLELGTCYPPEDPPIVETDSRITEIRLESLERLGGVVIGGQNHLVSLGGLHGTVAEGVGAFDFLYNANLPFGEIEQLANEAGKDSFDHCGNKDDPVDLCFPPNGCENSG